MLCRVHNTGNWTLYTYIYTGYYDTKTTGLSSQSQITATAPGQYS